MATSTTTEGSIGKTVKVPNGASSDMAAPRPATIEEALRLLDEAIAHDGANLKNLVTDEFANLRSAIMDLAPRMGETVREYGGQAYDKARTFATDRMQRGRELVGRLDENVRGNPWPIVLGVTIGSIALGFFLGRNSVSRVER